MAKYTEKRPWGGFTRYTENEQSTVKILHVHPGQRLSYQFHHNRDEHWVVLDGDPTIVIDDVEYPASAGHEFEIARKTKHRIIGGELEARILEISLGDFDEDDIVRIEDDFGRV